MPFFGGGDGDYHIIATNIKGGTNAAPAIIGTNNMALGNNALASALNNDNNIAIGNNALANIPDGFSGFTVIGQSACDSALYMEPVTAVGYRAGHGATLQGGVSIFGLNA